MNLDKKIPPPLVALICAGVMWGLSMLLPNISVNQSLRMFIALLVAATGLFFCIAGVLSFRRAKTTVNPLKPESTSSLVSSGVYRVSRNPMYLGFVFLLFAWWTYLSSPLAVIGVLMFVWYINRYQIQPEERALEQLFGADFERYKNAVRKWV